MTTLTNDEISKKNDREVMRTADDAVIAKLSASSLGYYDDPFLPYLCTKSSGLVATPKFEQNNISPSPSSSSSSSSSSRPFSSSFPSSRNSHRLRGLNHGRNHNFSHSKPQASNFQQHPIIRRGTHARVCVMDRSISSFLRILNSDKSPPCKESNNPVGQIVVLGGGKDTSCLRAWRNMLLRTENEATNSTSCNQITWYEIDHSLLIEEKAKLIASCPLLSHNTQVHRINIGNGMNQKNANKLSTNASASQFMVQMINETPTDKEIDLSTSNTNHRLHLVGHDLRETDQLFNIIQCLHNFNADIPTLFIMECVLMYLPEREGRNLLQSITTNCKQSLLGLYDPILSNDAFGKVMEQNLTRAGVADAQSSMRNTRTLESQLDKLINCGFSHAVGCDMATAYDTVVDIQQRIRANQIEMLDEVEEWILIMKHYCFIVASTNASNSMSSSQCKPKSRSIQSFSSSQPGNFLGFDPKRCTTRP